VNKKSTENMQHRIILSSECGDTTSCIRHIVSGRLPCLISKEYKILDQYVIFVLFSGWNSFHKCIRQIY